MIDKRFKIEGLDNVKIYVNQNLETFTIIVEEKIGYEWHPMLKKEFTVDDGEKFNLIDHIDMVIIEYAKKKKVEDDIKEILDQYEDGDTIEISD